MRFGEEAQIKQNQTKKTLKKSHSFKFNQTIFNLTHTSILYFNSVYRSILDHKNLIFWHL